MWKIMLFGISLSTVLGLLQCTTRAQKQPGTAKVKSNKGTKTDSDSILTLIAVGDIMLGTNYPNPSYLPPDKSNILLPVRDILRSANLTFGNLEGTVLNEGGEVKQCNDPSKCYAFRQPEYLVDFLKDAGFDLLSLANNHMGDFGQTGRSNTQRILKEKGIKYAGLETCPWDTIHVNGKIIGITAFAPNNGCLKLNDYSVALEVLKKLKKISDLVIVSFHGGAEGPSRTNVTRKTEEFVGENRGNVYEFAHLMVDNGADIVLGHGPHVTRAIDCYKGKFIAYSMGNFATYGRFSLSGVSGIAPIFKLYINKNTGNFIKGEVISIQQLGEGGPTIDPNRQVLNEIKRLCTVDFPEVPWLFNEDGAFRLK